MFYVVYGSQTGNSEAIAKRISNELKTVHKRENEFLVMNKFLQSMQKFPEKKSQKNFVIIVCSTTGNGDAPNNADNFVRWIKRKTHSNDLLNNVFYTILGLGDSNYSKYQYIPRQIDEYLAKLGAGKFYPKGEADEAYGLESVVEPWIANLYTTLDNFMQTLSVGEKASEEAFSAEATSKETVGKIENLKANNVEANTVEFQTKKNSEEEKNLSSKHNQIQNNSALKGAIVPEPPRTNQKDIQSLEKASAEIFENVFNTSDFEIQKNLYYNSSVISKNTLSGVKAQKQIVSLILSASERKFTQYTPGSAVSILPQAPKEILDIVYSVIELEEKSIPIDKNTNFEIYSNILEKYPHFNKIIEKKYISYMDIFEFFIDFSGVMKKSHTDNLKTLLHLKLNKNAENLLKSYDVVLSKYSELVSKNKLSLYDFLLDLYLENQKIKLSIKEIFEFFPIKYPRSYSLVSNSQVDSQNLEIVFTVVKEKIIRKFPDNLNLKGIKQGAYWFQGQCTQYLNSLDLDSKVILTEIKNNFAFPISKFIEESKPIVYICNGTGITPCISFLKEIKIASQRQNYYDMKNAGELKILTGFRNANEDKKETIHENFILDTVKSINKKLNRDVVEYIRCLSASEEKEEEEVGMWRSCRIGSSYVQDLILDNQETIIDLLINKNGSLMICGDLEKLYDECISNIVFILMKNNKYPRDYCIKLIEDMKNSNRLILEKWI